MQVDPPPFDFSDSDLTLAAAFVVPTLAQFQGMVARPSSVLLVGRLAAGDVDPGPPFAWFAGDTTTANDITVVAPTAGPSGRYKRPPGCIIQASWAGLAAGGVTDNQAALQACVNAIPIGTAGTIVVSQPGVFALASDVSENGRLPTFIVLPGSSFTGTGDLPYTSGNLDLPTGKLRLIQTDHPDLIGWANLGSPAFLVEGNRNGLISGVVNNLAPGGVSFPTAGTYIAVTDAAGNVSYSLYVENRTKTAGVSTAEFAAFSDAGAAPDDYPSFNTALGTTQHLPKALQITAGTTNTIVSGNITAGSAVVDGIASTAALSVGMLVQHSGMFLPFAAKIASKTANSITLEHPDGTPALATSPATGASIRCFWPAAIGLDFSPEGSSVGMWNIGMGFRKDGVRLYSIFQDADADEGSLHGAHFAIPGRGVNLTLKTAGTQVAKNAILRAAAASGTDPFRLLQDGSAYFGTFAAARPVRLNVAGSDTWKGIANVAAAFGVDLTAESTLGASVMLGSLAGTVPFIGASRYGAGDATDAPLAIVAGNIEVARFLVSAGLKFPIANIASHADDAAAAAGSIAVGQMYRNGSVLMIRAA